jgi:hypothetical protein
LLKTLCKGYDRYGVYADGNGGTYEELIETNSTTCGYVTPPPPNGGGGTGGPSGGGGGGGFGGGNSGGGYIGGDPNDGRERMDGGAGRTENFR